MSAVAVARVQQLWEKLTVHRVVRCVAREPEDVIHMELHAVSPADPTRLHYSGNLNQVVPSKRSVDVPDEDRWRLQTHWRHYYGFTRGGAYFSLANHVVFDAGLGLLQELQHDDWRHGRRGVYDPRPRKDEMIAGELSSGPKGPRFDRWFRCRREFLFLVGLIRQGQPVAIEELLQKLHTPSGGFGDTFWVFANLVLNDDVMPFVHSLMSETDRPLHPAAGTKAYGGYTITNHAILVPGDPVFWLFQLSRQLQEPEWWQRFNKEATERRLRYRDLDDEYYFDDEYAY